jgi:hypothetical protein
VNCTNGALLALLFLVLAGCGGGGTLDAEAFKKEAEAIQSFAAEGALLARDVADGRSTAPFTRIHAGELANSADKLAQTLETAKTTPALAEKLGQALFLTRVAAAALRQLEQAPGDAEAARTTQRTLEAAAKGAEELAGA